MFLKFIVSSAFNILLNITRRLYATVFSVTLFSLSSVVLIVVAQYRVGLHYVMFVVQVTQLNLFLFSVRVMKVYIILWNIICLCYKCDLLFQIYLCYTHWSCYKMWVIFTFLVKNMSYY